MLIGSKGCNFNNTDDGKGVVLSILADDAINWITTGFHTRLVYRCIKVLQAANGIAG